MVIIINNFILTFINKFGYIGIFLLIMIENLFPPIPSEVILTFSGFIAKTAQLNIFMIIFSSTLGSLIGALILYYLGYILNTNFFNKLIDTQLGHMLHLNKEHINSSIEDFNTNGKKSVFIGRLAPIVRSLISIPAGMSKMNLFEFIILTTLGSLIWNTTLILLGNMIGDNYLLISKFISKYYKPIIVILIILWLIKKKYKSRKIITSNK